MPVARDTTSAISSAPTCVRSSFGLLRPCPASPCRFSAAIELRFQLRQTAILQLRNLLPVSLALGRFHFQLDLLHLFLDVLGALHLGFFRVPDLFEISVLALQLRYFLLQQAQALLRGFVLLLLDRLAFDLELDQTAVEPVHRLRLGVDFHA